MILFINTGTSKTAIALIEKNKVISEKSWLSKNNEAERLMPEIDQLLQKKGSTYQDIKKIIVVKGPGSFTGLRVGVTVANAISYLNNCEIYGIDTFSFLWLAELNKLKNSALLLYAGRDGVYLSSSKDCPDFAGKAVNINVANLSQTLQKEKIENVFGDISEEQKKQLKPAKFHPFKETFGEIAAKIDLSKLSSVKIVKPVYIKKPF